jgi:hypothetical protein
MQKILALLCAVAVITAGQIPVAGADTVIGSSNRAVDVNYENTQWGVGAIRAEQARTITDGNGVVVAVIDTGVDATHPDLAGKVLAGWSTVKKAPLAVGGANDGAGHGTHVAGIIAGAVDDAGIAGVAPGARILPVQVLGTDGSGTDRTVADGIDWAVAQGAKVINLSLGGSVNPFSNGGSRSCISVGAAYDADVVVIVASGNAGAAGNPRNEPASCRGAVSVAAVDERLNRTAFSSFDSTVAISAPGAAIVSALPQALGYPYAQWDGTSMAAPHVAGVAALVRATYPEWSAQEVIDRLLSSVVDLGPAGADPEFGAGLVDAAAAVGLGRVGRDVITVLIAERTVPTVVAVEANSREVNISWFAPKFVTVDRYEVVLTEESGTTRYPVAAGRTSVTVNHTGIPRKVALVAYVDGAPRTSVAFIEIVDNTIYSTASTSTKIIAAKASWTSKGIKLSYTPKGPRAAVSVSLIAYGDTFFIYETIASDRTSIVYPVGVADPVRSMTVTISVSTEISSRKITLAPQYPISATALTAGPEWRSVIGSTRELCNGPKKKGCSGAVVELRDASNGKVAARVHVLANLRYAFDLSTKKMPSSVYVAVGAERSPTVGWGARS